MWGGRFPKKFVSTQLEVDNWRDVRDSRFADAGGIA